MKQFLFLITILLLCVAFVQANEYTSVLQDDGKFQEGFFNLALTNYSVASRSISTPSLAPLVADLNGDGTNEIIVMDGDSVRLYHGKELAIIDTVVMMYYDASFRPTMWTIADLNDDGRQEVIIPAPDGSGLLNVNFLNYDGIVFSNAYNITSSVGAGVFDGQGEMGLGCDDTNNKCLLSFSRTNSYAVTGNSRGWGVVGFNTTNFGTAITDSATGSGANHGFCLAHIPVIAVDDIDFDSVTDFTGNILHMTSSGFNDPLITFSYEMPSGLTLSAVFKFNNTEEPNDIANSGSSNNCRGDVTGNLFTAPLVHEFDGSPSNGKEVVYANMIDGTNYKMYVYDQPYTLFEDDHPESVTGISGTLVGNIFVANAFDDSGNNEYCVSGFVGNNTINETHVLCGSLLNNACGGLCDDIDYDTTTPYNISSAQNFPFSTMITAGQMQQAPNSGVGGTKNFDEVLTSFGVYRLDTTIFGVGFLAPIWNNFNLTSQRFGAVIGVDVENVSRTDLLMLSQTNLWYFDDGFSNSPAEITAFSMNPCLGQTWKQNTTVSFGLTADDVDSDLVHCQAFMYYGTLNEQFQNGSFQAHGSTFNFGFTAFNTTGIATIRGECEDSHNLGVFDVTEYSFSVATSGVEFGDCMSSGSVVDVPTNLTNTSLTPVAGNIITNLLAPLNTRTGLGMTIIWLIIMVIVAIAGFVGIMNAGGTHIIAGAIIGFSEVLLLIIGAFLGFIGLGVIFTIVLIAIAITVIVVRQVAMGSR